MERNDVVKKAIIKHLKRNLKTRYGMFSNQQGELKDWFERHLDDIVPMAFGPKDTDGRAVVNAVFVQGRTITEVATIKLMSKRTVYNRIDVFFLALVDKLPDKMYVELSLKAAAFQMWRLKGCPQCKGDMYFDEVGGAVSRGSEWVCKDCGNREEHEAYSQRSKTLVD